MMFPSPFLNFKLIFICFFFLFDLVVLCFAPAFQVFRGLKLFMKVKGLAKLKNKIVYKAQI